MKVLFVDPPMISGSQFKNYPNLGILYIVSNVRKHLPQVEMSYIPGRHPYEYHIRRIKEEAPDVLAISFASYFMSVVYRLLAEVRRALPNVVIYAGGPMPSSNPREVLENSEVDICCKGEGELTSVEVFKALMNKEDLSGITGITYKDGPKICENADRPFIGSLDDLPHPAWDLVDLTQFRGNVRSRVGAGLSTCTVISRGCPYDCTFCSQPVWKMQKPWVRTRSPHNVIEEIDHLYSKGIREIFIRADELNYNRKAPIALCKEIIKRGYKDLYFQCNVYARHIDDEVADYLARAGFWLVNMGIESANARVLEGIQKKITVEQIVDGCRLLKKHGIKILGYFMLYQAWEENGKLAFETTPEVNNTLNFIWKMKRKGLLDYMSWNFATPIEGSKLYDVAMKYNLIDKEELKIETGKEFWEPAMTLPGISMKEMQKMRRKGFLLQGYCALKSGHALHPKNFSRIWARVKHIAVG